MPVYTYECGICGMMELSVPLALSDKEISCPLCAFNASLADQNGQSQKIDFHQWIDVHWQKFDAPSEIPRLRRVLDAPMFVVR